MVYFKEAKIKNYKGWLNQKFAAIDRQNWYLVALAALGLCFRLYGISESSLWLDEAQALTYLSYAPIGDRIKEILCSSTHPPLYYLLIVEWIKIFGVSEFSLRLPSALADAASIFLLGKFSLRLSGSRLHSTISAVIYCFAFTPLYFSQEARPYSLMICVGLLYLTNFYSLTPFSGWVKIFTCALLAVILAQLHYFGLVSVAALSIAAVVFASVNRRIFMAKWSVGFSLVSLLSYAYYLPFMLVNMRQPQDWILPASFSRLVDFVVFSLGPETSIFIKVIFVGLCIGYLAKIKKYDFKIIFGCLVWLLFVPLFAFIFGAIFQPIWLERYFIVGIPAASLLLGYLAAEIATTPKVVLAVAAAACYGVFFSTISSDYFYNRQKGGLKSAIEEIHSFESREAHTSPLVGCGYFTNKAWLDFYSEKILKRPSLVSYSCDESSFAAIDGTPAPSFFLVIFSRRSDPLLTQLGAGWKISKVFVSVDTDVFYLERKKK